MKKLNEIVNQYLEAKDTDYALMINGKWGCGKTYYLEHEFKDIVEQKESPCASYTPISIIKRLKRIWEGHSDKCYFEVAFISLYGVSSPEDFYYRVFLGVNSWAKKKIFTFVGSVGARIANRFNINISKEDTSLINIISSNTIFVFDDLERICSDKISVKEILGLINDYSEHNHYKVIIVCNEDVYAKNAFSPNNNNEEYWKYKEKTIRYTYNFVADVQSVFDTIVKTYKDENFRKYVEQNKSFILNIFEIGGEKNLRTLKFYLDSMSNLYSNVPEVKYKENILRTLLVSTMIYATEYKKGKEKKDLEELKDRNEMFLGKDMFFQTAKKGESEPRYSQDILKNYGSFYKQEMIKLPFVIDYLITGYLDRDALNNWVNARHEELLDVESKPEYDLYNELSSFATVDDNKLVGQINLLIDYVKEGKYKVLDLMGIYALVLNYDAIGIDGFTLTDDIEKTFMDAIDRYKKGWKYLPILEYKMPMWNNSERETDSFKRYEVLRQYLLQMNNQSRLAENKAKCDEFLQKAEQGDIEGLRHYRENKEERISLAGVDWLKICNVLDKGSNPIACELCFCLQTLVSTSSSIGPNDMDLMKETLHKWLNEYEKRGDKRVRRLYILDLKSHIDSLLK
jgi:KAP family P-loop domain